MRYAVYLTPPEGSPLARTAAAWLGRSAFDGALRTATAPAAANVSVPARYGFHATLKAPFRLRAGRTEADLLRAFDAYAAALQPLAVRLAVSRLSRFVALTAVDHGRVSAACDAAVSAFEPFRAPLTTDDRAKRQPDRLAPRERELLDAWGYPYVFDRFLFHMTLTGPLEEDAIAGVEAAVRSVFSPFLAEPQPLLHALFRETEGGFTILALEPVGAAT